MNRHISIIIAAVLILIAPGLSRADVTNGDFSSGLDSWITYPSDQVVATDGGFGGVIISDGQAVLRTAGLNSGYPDIRLYQETDLPVGSFQVEFNYQIGNDGPDADGGTYIDPDSQDYIPDNLIVYMENGAGLWRNITRVYSSGQYDDGSIIHFSSEIIENTVADTYWLFFNLKDENDCFFTKVALDDIHITQITPGPAPVPEPGTMLLLGSGLAGLAGARRKRKEKTQ